MLNVMVLYPQQTDVQQFESDYAKHLVLFHEKMGIPANVKPYTLTKFLPTPGGMPSFHQMFTFPFESPESLQTAMTAPSIQEVGDDANRISTGGAPVILIGNAE